MPFVAFIPPSPQLDCASRNEAWKNRVVPAITGCCAEIDAAFVLGKLAEPWTIGRVPSRTDGFAMQRNPSPKSAPEPLASIALPAKKKAGPVICDACNFSVSLLTLATPLARNLPPAVTDVRQPTKPVDGTALAQGHAVPDASPKQKGMPVD